MSAVTQPRTYRFTILDQAQRTSLKPGPVDFIPGIYVDRGLGINCPENAYGVLSKFLTMAGIPFSVVERGPKTRLTLEEILNRQELNDLALDFLSRTKYQLDALEFSCNKAGAILAHATGSGKSLTALAWSLAADGQIVYVTKAGARGTMTTEIKKFTRGIEYRVLTGLTPEPLSRDVRLYLIGAETLSAWTDALCATGFKSLVLDESHKMQARKRYCAEYLNEEMAAAIERGNVKLAPGEFMKREDPDPGAEPWELGQAILFKPLKTMAASAARLARQAQRRLLASATPIPDRVRNLWAQLDQAEPKAWGSSKVWLYRYAGARPGRYGGIEALGATNQIELQERVSTVMHVVTKAEANRDLPPLRRAVLRLEPDELDRPAGGFIQALRRCKTIQERREVELMRTASMKRTYMIEQLLRPAVECKQKVLILTGRRKDTDQLGEAIETKLKGSLTRGTNLWVGHGEYSDTERDAMRDAYMAAPGPAVLVGTMHSFGECVAPDTLVLGDDPKPIADLVVGDRVASRTGSSEVLGKKFRKFDGEMVELAGTGLLPFAATPNHPVLVRPGRKVRYGHGWRIELGSPEWKRIDTVRSWRPDVRRPQMSSGDYLMIPRLKGRFRAKTFDLSKYVKQARNNVAGRVSRGLPTSLTVDKDMAWLMGLYVAEGSATLRRKGTSNETCALEFSLGSHELDLALRVEGILRKCGLKASHRYLRRTNGMIVTCKSTPLGRLFREQFGAGAHNKRIPKDLLESTDLSLLTAFLQGYVDGDGAFDGHKFQAVTVSRTLALQLQLALARLGTFAKVYAVTPKQNGLIRGRVVKSGPYYAVHWTASVLYHVRHRVEADHIAVPVKRVTRKAYSGQVVDIETSDHTFTVSNAVVHNSHNLQDTDALILPMLPPEPWLVVQSEGRVSRKGMTRPALVYYLVAKGTIDESVAVRLLDKLPAIEKLAGDTEAHDILQALRGSAEEILADLEKTLATNLGEEADLERAAEAALARSVESSEAHHRTGAK
jgi:hypothetical protein